MSDEQPRTDATSRERSPDHQYSLSIEQTAELYAKAGHPAPCAPFRNIVLSKARLPQGRDRNRRKIPGRALLRERHIAYINEVRTVATSRDQTRTDATVRTIQDNVEPSPVPAANSNEQPRPFAAVRTDLEIFEHPYVKRLEAEVDEFKTKYEKQVRRTEDVLEDANRRLIEMAQAGQIAGSKTLAEYLLAAKNPSAPVNGAATDC